MSSWKRDSGASSTSRQVETALSAACLLWLSVKESVQSIRHGRWGAAQGHEAMPASMEGIRRKIVGQAEKITGLEVLEALPCLPHTSCGSSGRCEHTRDTDKEKTCVIMTPGEKTSGCAGVV
eukprot:758643-Hanusia_phi.AAC.1